MYPVLKEGVSIGTFKYEGSDTIHYYVENAAGKEYEISHLLWETLLNADGTHPLGIRDTEGQILRKLKKAGIVRTSRFVRGAGLFNRLIIVPFKANMHIKRKWLRVLNANLPAVSVLLFAAGLLFGVSPNATAIFCSNWWVQVALIILSLTLHELGHLLAGLAFEYNPLDMGILLLGVIPVGAYVSFEEPTNTNRAEQLQFSAAGIEINLLLAGVFLIISKQAFNLRGTFLSVATINALIAIVNLLPAAIGLDGEGMLSALFGVKSIGKNAIKWLLSKQYRAMYPIRGLAGCVKIVGYCFSLLSTVIVLVLLLVEVIVVLLIAICAWY